MSRGTLAACACIALACGRSGAPPSDPAAAPAAAPQESAPTATPVTVAPVRRQTLSVRVSGPGATAALQVQAIRAPFAGTLTDLLVQDGDRVAAGQVLGHLASRDSVAALEGARSMLRSARTPQERSDAERALTIAERSQVAAALRAPGAGVVVSHQAGPGALVAQDQDVLTIAATGAIVFVARIDQSALSRVRPGEAATVEVPAMGASVPGRVHSLLPLASATEYSAPVRIDFTSAARPAAPGLFGTASIVVAQVADAQVVPAAAALRDDVTGVTRVAVVAPGNLAHWIDVEIGVAEGGAVQIVSPALPQDGRVITSGLVGLPEGAPVQVQP
ncbi:MAG TPA: HlyD family efflux transporter periplasmic adaptor subunit [Anaeromyxobacter sp.]